MSTGCTAERIQDLEAQIVALTSRADAAERAHDEERQSKLRLAESYVAETQQVTTLRQEVASLKDGLIEQLEETIRWKIRAEQAEQENVALRAELEKARNLFWPPDDETEAHIEQLGSKLARVEQALKDIGRANSHFGPGPHCTCSQRERETIASAALAPEEAPRGD